MRQNLLTRGAAIGGAILIGASGFAAAPALAATAAHVDIRVELDLVEGDGTPWGSGPAVFEVTDAPIGAGPELTGADLVANPSGWCGSVTVDVDPVASTVTVAAEESCDFTDVRVWVSSPDFATFSLVSDDLLVPRDDEEGPIDPEELTDEAPEGVEPLDAPSQQENVEPSSEETIETAPLAIGAASAGISSRSVVRPAAAPGSLATLDWSFAAPQLAAAWHVDQSGAAPDTVMTENLGGSTVFQYAKALTATGSGDPTPLLLGAGLLMLAGAVAATVAGTRRARA